MINLILGFILGVTYLLFIRQMRSIVVERRAHKELKFTNAVNAAALQLHTNWLDGYNEPPSDWWETEEFPKGTFRPIRHP